MADGGGESEMPRDAKIVKELLKSMNVEDYEPRVIHHFLELWYRHAVDVLTDAQVYSEHAGKSTIDLDDVKLAIQSAIGSRFSQPPSREMLLDLAKSRNKNPLPKATPGPGMPLPPEEDTLISPNFQLALPRKQSSRPVEEPEEDEEDPVNPNPTQPNPNTSSSQEPRDFPQGGAHQRVSFPLGGAKNSR